MKKWMVKEIHLFAFLLLIENIYSATYQTLVYLAYTPSSDGTNPDTHSFEMFFSESGYPPHPDDQAKEYRVSLQRNSADTITNFQYKGSNTRNRRYLYYFMGMNLLHPYGRSYVAYNINLNCSASPAAITFLVKYFSCDGDASAFYASAAGNKLRVNAAMVAESTSMAVQNTFSGVYTCP